MLGRKLGMKKQGQPSQKWCKLISKPHPRHTQERTDIYKNNWRHFLHVHLRYSGCKLTTGLSSSNLRQLGAYCGFINILHIYTSDYNRLSYGKTYPTELTVIQLAIVNGPWAYAHLPSLSWLVVGTSSILHGAQPKKGAWKYKKGEAKRNGYNSSFGLGLI